MPVLQGEVVAAVGVGTQPAAASSVCQGTVVGQGRAEVQGTPLEIVSFEESLRMWDSVRSGREQKATDIVPQAAMAAGRDIFRGPQLRCELTD